LLPYVPNNALILLGDFYFAIIGFVGPIIYRHFKIELTPTNYIPIITSEVMCLIRD